MTDDWLSTIRGDVRETLRRARIGYTDLSQDVTARSVSVKIRDAAELDKAYQELRKLAAPIGGNVFSGFSGYDLDVATKDDTVMLTVTDAGLTHRMSSAIQASIETIRRRVDAFGTTEPSIQREARSRVLVQVPGISDVERLKTLIGETGKLEFKLVDPSANPEQIAQSKVVPPGDELLYGNPPSGAPQGSPQIPYVLKNQVLVTGQNLVDAQPSFDQRTGEPVVTFRFDAAGATRFGKVTSENVGLPFAIILDNKVISAPVIREPILGGTGQISGHFSVQEANDLAVLLRSGALPAKLTVIEERTVGASLGADSIEAGKKAALMGLALVMIFMLAGYGLFGLFANLALIINIALIFAVLSLMGATLTLPGIAGIVLTIGIAVDANVLINERIREEIRAGKSPFAAVDAGYSRALITIIDSNVTTLIAVLVLFWLGSGPVRGFAVTLTVGVLASMFTAVTVTRLMVAYWLRWTRPQLIPI
jgi:protein-export membrane protein SecD